MLGDKRKPGASASIEARIKGESYEQSQEKRIKVLKKEEESVHHSKTSMMEFLHKKATKRVL
jgi:hypothetical protein